MDERTVAPTQVYIGWAGLVKMVKLLEIFLAVSPFCRKLVSGGQILR